MTPITDAGREHLARLEAERADKRHKRLTVEIEVGTVVEWPSRTSGRTEVGTVVDMDARGRLVVAVEGDLTVTASDHGTRRSTATRAVRLVTTDPARVANVRPRTAYGMHRTVRQLAAGVCNDLGLLDEGEAELLHTAVSLLDESGTVEGG